MCLNPLRGTLPPDGGRISLNSEGDIQIPCGKCIECKTKHAQEWALRAHHEMSLHDQNCFLTLTYDNEHYPETIKYEFQKFIKRLRKHAKKKLLYIASHEYGSKTKRLHHHAIIFGWSPSDQIKLKKTPKGYDIFTSETLSKLWKLGHHSIGEANAQTAYYISSYTLKQKTHSITEEKTGEIRELKDQFDCSKRPAIGLEYLKKNYKQLVASKAHLPRYYLKKLEIIDSLYLQQYENDKKIRVKDMNELYAIAYIKNQKRNQNSSHLREEQTTTEDNYILRNLKKELSK